MSSDDRITKKQERGVWKGKNIRDRELGDRQPVA